MERPKKGRSEEGGVSRRDVLGGMGAAAVLLAAQPETLFAKDSFDDEECLAFFNSLQSDPERLKNFREEPSIEDITKLTRALAIVNKEWTVEVSARSGALHAGARIMQYQESGRFVGNGTVLRIRDPEKSAGGAPVYRYCEVTAAHVVGAGQAGWTYHATLDIAVREITDEQELGTAEKDHLPYSWTGTRGQHDVSFQEAVILGVDKPNESVGDSATSLGKKCYTSRISPQLSPGVFRGMHVSVPDESYYQVEPMQYAVHAVVLPAGEAHKPNPALNQLPAQGMSGSALLIMPRTGPGEGVQFGGIIVSVAEVPCADGRTYSIGFVLNHLDVRETIGECLNLKEVS